MDSVRQKKVAGRDAIQNGNIELLQQILAENNWTLDDLLLGPSYDLVILAAYNLDLDTIKQLLAMGMKPRADLVYANLETLFEHGIRPMAFTFWLHGALLKTMLFLLTQPGTPEIGMNARVRQFLADARLRARLVKILAEINEHVSLVLPQAERLREYLARAGLNVPELIKDAMNKAAFNRRKDILGFRPTPKVGASGGESANNTKVGGRRRRTRRRKNNRR